MTILCTIDLETREVSLPSGQCIAAYDHNVDVIRFQAEAIPGFSLNTSSIKIAAQGPNKVRHDYAVDPSTVQIEEETGYITFDWPIPAGVTEMPIGSGFKYGDRGQLIFAVCAEIISGSTVSKAWHSDDGIITVVAHLEPESGGGEDPEEEATNAQKIGQLQTDVAVMRTQIGAVAGGVPTVVDYVSDMTDTGLIYILSSDGYWYYYDGSDWTQGGTYGGAVTSTTFNQHGVPADDFAVGEALAEKTDTDDVDALDDRVTALESGSGGGLTADIKSALLACFANVAWAGNDGQDFYDALDIALNPPANLVSISAVYTQSGAVYTNTSLDSLKSDLVVTATYSDSTTSVISSGYTLSGTLTEGTSAITVSYGGKTTTFNVTVIPAPKMEYDTDDGDMSIITGGNEPLNAISGEILSNTQNATVRRGVCVDYGAKPMYRGTQQSYQISDYYPIPVPATAIRAEIRSDISNSIMAIIKWSLTENGYTQNGNSGWGSNNFASLDFTAKENEYITINCKGVNDYSQSNPAPSRFIITFSE